LSLVQNATYGSGYRCDRANTVWLIITAENEYIFIDDMSIKERLRELGSRLKVHGKKQ